MTVIAFVAGLLLPWLVGIAGLAAVRHRAASGEGAGEIPWIIGAGYFAGVFTLTLWMRLLSGIGVMFGWSSIALPLLLFTGVLAYVAIRRDRSLFVTALPHAMRSFAASPGLAGGARWLWWLLVAWLAVRFTLLALEVTWQPLYPWDAWIQWATKARVWYELGHIVPFARTAEWFAANGAAYFDASPEYPPTVPLMQVWANIALGHWDDALMNWPWWQIAVALSLAVFGGLRRIGLAPVSALVGAFLVASIPLANVHVALAGYADFPLAAFFTVAVLAFLCWNKARRVDDAGLALFLLFACTQIKNPGLFWALTLVPGVIVALFPARGLRIAGAMFGVGVMLLLVLAQTNFTVFLYRLHLDFDPGWQQLGESYFLMGNWNLLWYGLIAVALLLRRDLFARPLAPFTIVMVGGLLFLFLVFGFTNAREWLAQQTTVNRATLHLAPLMTVYLLIAFHVFAQRWTATHAWAEPVAATAATAALAPAVRRPPIQVPAPPPLTAPVPAMASAGRNDPCPCGSGKRYKHCHGAAESITAPVPDPSADAHIHRAMQAHQRGDLVAAERDYREALAIVPGHPHATHYLGVIHYQRQRLADALPLLQQAVLRIPHEPEFHNNLGLALAAADRATEAAVAHRQAIALRPDHAGAWNNLGLALQAANELPQAIEAFRTALRLDADFREAHWNLGLALLLQGEYREGFREYEWRLDIAALGKVHRDYPGPRWDGGDPAGKTLLLTREQGLGDTLQFARFASTLAGRGARVMMEVPDPLRRLMASVPGVASVCGADEPLPAYDAHAPLLSIPGLLDITADTIPRSVPYITPGADDVAAIMPLLERYRGTLKVGLAWAGSRAHWNDRRRSCPLATLAPLLTMPGITWFSLQKDDGEDEIAAVPAAAGLVLLEARNDFDRKAALVAALDLVISVDTSNAHLAGALARPLWVLLASAPDWRWQLDRKDSPWYPTARLFRQPRAGDWPAVVAEMSEALRVKTHAAAVSPA